MDSPVRLDDDGNFTLEFTVGLNLIQSAFTHWCLMERILARVGFARPI